MYIELVAEFFKFDALTTHRNVGRELSALDVGIESEVGSIFGAGGTEQELGQLVVELFLVNAERLQEI